MRTDLQLATHIDSMQLNSAASKHAQRLLRYNADYGTLDLFTINMSGSYLRNPIGTFRLYSAQRLSFPESFSEEDIIRIIFYKEKELFSLDISLEIFHSPKKLVSALQTLGITFTSTLHISQLGKLLADYITRELTFENIIAYPGWGYFPKDNNKLKFLLPENIPDSISTKKFRNLEISTNENISLEESLIILKRNHLFRHPIVKLLFLLRLATVLQTLFSIHNCNIAKIINIIIDQNIYPAKNALVSFLSIYKNKTVYPLPMSKKELNKIMQITNDDFIFFNIPNTLLLTYQRALLIDNLKNLLHTQESSKRTNHFIPIVFSTGILPDLSLEDTLPIPIEINNDLRLESDSISALGNLTLDFIRFAEKNLDLIENIINESKHKYHNFNDNLIISLLSTSMILKKFLLINTNASSIRLSIYTEHTNKQIIDYLHATENHENIIGISEHLIKCILKCISDGEINIQSISVCWEPQKNATKTILMDDDFIYITPEIFDNIVKTKFSQTLPLSVLKQLYADGLLIADASGNFHYKKKVGYLTSSNTINYRRFVVIKRSMITPLNGPKLM